MEEKVDSRLLASIKDGLLSKNNLENPNDSEQNSLQLEIIRK